MADLDDFFAKKDRKKSKTKKFATTEEVAKKLEDTSKKQKETVKKERQPENNEIGTENQDQDEWREFEEEKKDYTGLKIGNLTLNAEVEQSNGNNQESSGEQQQDNVDEGGNEEERKPSGPWKKLSSDAPEAPPPVEEKKPEPTTTLPNVSGLTYVPPSRRNQPSQPQSMQPSRLRSKAAPDINNEDFFPTLAGTKDKKNAKEGTFEVVSHNKSNSLKYVEQSKMSSQTQKLSTANRYNTLSNDS